MARTPFKLRSGNASAFKSLGSSPAKDVNKSRKIAEENKPDTSIKASNYRTELKTIKPTTERDIKPKEDKQTTVVIPKSHPVIPPTEEQSKKSQGTIEGKTGFEHDVVDPIKSKVRQGIHLLKDNIITNIGKKMVETDKRRIKKVKDYFTKR